MLPDQKYLPEDILRILWRGRWLIVLPAVIGLVAGVVVSGHLPEKYRSETMILVVPQRIPNEVVPRTNTDTVAERLNSINDVILSRSRLERIIRDLDLYGHARAMGTMEDVVQRMRNEINVKVEGKESFRVSYVSDTAKTAQMVTDRLASLYIEENLRDQKNLAESTNQFLESQLEEAKRRLLDQEKKLEEYKSRHAGELPSQQAANLQTIQSAQAQLQTIGESTNRARERRILIERQLADAQTIPVSRAPETAPTADPAAGLTTAQQLEAAQQRLDLFKLRYTPDHPDVKTLERTISDLQKKMADEAARSPVAVTARTLTPAEAARQRQIGELQAQLEVQDHQIAANDKEELRLKATIAEYQAMVAAVPARESELVELLRDYGTFNETYTSLLKKKEDSKLAENLVHRQIGEQFRVLDAASLPEKPYNRMQRLALLAAGPIGGLAIGLVLLAFFEYRDSSFKTESDVQRVLTLPVLALVPRLASERERDIEHRRRLVVDVGGVLVLLTSVAALIVWRWQS